MPPIMNGAAQAPALQSRTSQYLALCRYQYLSPRNRSMVRGMDPDDSIKLTGDSFDGSVKIRGQFSASVRRHVLFDLGGMAGAD